ncbi:MAG TPA: DedA family protein [Chroococcidiopsis sp.]
MHVDLLVLTQALGYLVIWAIVLAESGFVVGFFLPSDSFLFTAGFLAAQGFLDMEVLTLGCWVCAMLGASWGYGIGRRRGLRLMQRSDSWLFQKQHLLTTELLYEQNGPKTLVLARFLPIVRTFAPVVAGIHAMPYPLFTLYNLIGAIGWAIGVPLVGLSLGRASMAGAPDRFLLLIVMAIALICIAPSVVYLCRRPPA